MGFSKKKKTGKKLLNKKIKLLIGGMLTQVAVAVIVVAVIAPLLVFMMLGSGTIYEFLYPEDAVVEKEDEKKVQISVGCPCAVLSIDDNDIDSNGTTGDLNEKTVITGSSNEEKSWNFFISKGFSKYGTAIIMGNLSKESEFDPTAVNGGPNGDIQKGKAYGLAQWLDSGRQDNLVKWCGENGFDYKTLEGQLNFIYHEITSPYGYKESYNIIKNAKESNYIQGVKDFGKDYENPGDAGADWDKRQNEAKRILGKYGNNETKTATNSTGTSNTESVKFTGSLKNLVDSALPAAYACEKYLNISTVAQLCQLNQEGGTRFGNKVGEYIMPSSYYDGYMSFFGIAGENKFTGKKCGSSSRWRGYTTVTECVVDHACYLSNDLYSPNNMYKTYVHDVYDKGFREQLKGIGKTTYCTEPPPSEYYSHMTQHISKFECLNDFAVIEKYLTDNNLWDEYNKAVEWIEKYDKKYKELYGSKYAGMNKNVNSTEVKTSESITSSTKCTALYDKSLCTCPVDCPNCDCHPTGDSSQSNKEESISIAEHKGKFQGFWTNEANKTLSSDEMWKYAKNRLASYEKMENYIGVANKDRTVSYSIDKWKDKFGEKVGFIYYRQPGDYANSPIVPNLNNTASDYVNFCSGYSVSMALSTLTHRYISPAEISIAANTYNLRHNTEGRMFVSGATMLENSAMLQLINEQTYDGKKMFNASWHSSNTKDGWDKTLEAGGLIIWSSDKHNSSTNTGFAAGSGHWVVIREKITEGGKDYYLIGNSNCKPEASDCRYPDYKNTFDNLKKAMVNSSNHAGSIHILPSSGYVQYINNSTKDSNEDTDDSSVGAGSYGSNKSTGGYDKTKQTDSRWGRQYLGNSTSTISGAGCFLTSLYMQMCRAGAINSSKYTVADLNNYGKSHGGFSGNMLNTGSQCWNNYAKTHNIKSGSWGLVARIDKRYNLDNASDRESACKKIKKYYDKGYYIILQIDYKGGASGDHFVALQSVNTSSNIIKVADPARSNGNIVNTYSGQSKLNLVSIRVFKY